MVGVTLLKKWLMKKLTQSIAVLYRCMVAMPLGQAVSDKDVYLIKAEEAAFVIHKPKPPIILNENLGRKITRKASR